MFLHCVKGKITITYCFLHHNNAYIGRNTIGNRQCNPTVLNCQLLPRENGLFWVKLPSIVHQNLYSAKDRDVQVNATWPVMYLCHMSLEQIQLSAISTQAILLHGDYFSTHTFDKHYDQMLTDACKHRRTLFTFEQTQLIKLHLWSSCPLKI